MKPRDFMSIAAIISSVFGLAFILAPAQLMSIYGVSLEASGGWVGRYLGSAFLGIGALTWLARDEVKGRALRAVLVGDLVVGVTGLVVAICDAIFGDGNALVWSTVAIYLFLTVGFGYSLSVKPERS